MKVTGYLGMLPHLLSLIFVREVFSIDWHELFIVEIRETT